VKGYPHVVLYVDGKNSGDNPSHLRSDEDVKKFMRRKFSFASHQIRSKADLELFTSHPDGGVIGIFPEEDEATGNFFSRSFHKIVGALVDDYRFAHVTDLELASELFANKKRPDGLWNNIVLHRPSYFNSPFEDAYVVFDGDKLAAGLIRTFVKDHQVGLCPILTVDQFHATRPPMVMFYFHFDIQKGTSFKNNSMILMNID
jgi:hypothetical protein